MKRDWIFRRSLHFLPILIIPSLALLASGGPSYAETTCTINASCCSAEAICTVNQKCVCSAVCSSSNGSCECHCEALTGGGPSCGCKGSICCEALPVDVDTISLHGVLSDLGKRTGMEFVAPTIDPNLIVSVHVSKMGFGDWVNEIAKQLQALPVYRAKSGAIEFVANSELYNSHFSNEPLNQPFDAKFLNTDVGNAIRLIGEAADIDIVVPSGLTGRVTGNFPALSWKASLEAVLAASGNRARVVMLRNGLVHILP